MKIRKLSKSDFLKITLAIIYSCMIFIPLIRMFLFIDTTDMLSVIFSDNFLLSISNSMLVATISTIIVVILAYILAYCTERINLKGKKIFRYVFVLPMLIPSISHGIGIIFLFGNNGLITNILGVNIGIYGMKGIVLGSVTYALPVAYLMFTDVMKYEDYTSYEAATILGISSVRRFIKITLPYLKKPLISIIFTIFTLVITDYGVPLMISGRFITIPMIIYQEVIGQLNFGKGIIYGSFLLVPAILAFFVDFCNEKGKNSRYIIQEFLQEDSCIKKGVAYIICGVISIFIILPIGVFLLHSIVKDFPLDFTLTMENFKNVYMFNAGRYLFNSIIIALCVSIVGIIIGFFTAYLAARMKSITSKFLHLSAMLTAAVPGIVLGLAYILCFKRSCIQGTIVILVMVNTIHFIASPYLMIYNSLSKINENIESVGETLGIGKVALIRDVFIPMCSKTIAEMFIYFFVNCMMTISAVSFLATTSNKPISLMINQFEAQAQLESAAVVSLLILIINIGTKWSVNKIQKTLPREKRSKKDD